MRTAIDRAGRVIVPKKLRERLGLTGGEVLEIRERDGLLELEPAATSMELEKRGGAFVAVPEIELPRLTGDIVRETLERSRR